MERFGRLVAVERVGSTSGHARWRCVCDCGREVEVLAGHLRSGHTRSCGCARRETAAAIARAGATHGQSRTVEFRIWTGIRTRCSNPNAPEFSRYGGRGIALCERWQRFENFLADMGKRPSPGMSIDRIDNDGPYTPENCRWATCSEQGRNKRTNRLVNGIPLVEAAERAGVTAATLAARLKRGWSVEKATKRAEVA